MVLIKFWLHISADEQLKRFKRRDADPLKRWKLTDEDWRNRAKRGEYEEAVEEMLSKTSIPEAPWHLVEANSKRYARVKVLETVCAEMERGMAAHGLEVSPVLEAAIKASSRSTSSTKSSERSPPRRPRGYQAVTKRSWVAMACAASAARV